MKHLVAGISLGLGLFCLVDCGGTSGDSGTSSSGKGGDKQEKVTCTLQKASLAQVYCTAERPELVACPSGAVPDSTCRLTVLANGYCCPGQISVGTEMFGVGGAGGLGASSGASGFGGSLQEGTSTGVGGSLGGDQTVTCLTMTGGLQVCSRYENINSSLASSFESTCTTSEKGVLVDSCPQANLVGCCTENEGSISSESCYYTGGSNSVTVAEIKMACTGKFSLQP